MTDPSHEPERLPRYGYVVMDDEAIMRKGMTRIIDWEGEGFRLVGTASDGDGGLKLLLEQQPELALIDIRMPGLSGLELIREARAAGYTGYAVILTAYSEFEYAREAIRHDVEAYLLKPVDREELLRAVREIRGKLDAEARAEGARTELNRLRLTEAIRHALLKQPLPDPSVEKELDALFQRMGGQALAVALKDTMTLPGDSRDAFRDAVAARPPFPDLPSIHFMAEDQEIFVVFAKEAEEVAEHVAHYLHGATTQAVFPAAMGFPVNDWRNLTYSYEVAAYLLERHVLFEPDELLGFDRLAHADTSRDWPDPSVLPELLRFGDREDVRDYVDRFVRHARNVLADLETVKREALTIRDALPLDDDAEAALVRTVREAPTLRGIAQAMMDCLLDERERLQAEDGGASASSSAVAKCRFYIRQHYTEDISLRSCAERYHYNPNYLGRIFRETTGRSFATELTDYRLRAAAERLRRTEEKVYEVAQSVGFSHADTFYVKFRERYGTTPAAYRESAGASGNGADGD